MKPHFSASTRALLHKGREHVDELAETRAHWQFDVLIHPSDTDPGGVILEIANLSGQSER
jgi:16S rRNA (guanine527-N7)-methyltransferase